MIFIFLFDAQHRERIETGNGSSLSESNFTNTFGAKAEQLLRK
jgi:hypothetical protein